MGLQHLGGFDGVHAVHPPGTEHRHKFGGEAVLGLVSHLLSLTLVDVLKRTLAWGFQQIDGALIFRGHVPDVSELTVVKGRRKFITVFRQRIVGRQTVPAGEIEAVFIPIPASQDLHNLVVSRLWQQGVRIRGKLFAAAVAHIPYRLLVGGDPLGLPPFLQHVGQEFPSLVATGDPYGDGHVVRVVQLLYRRRTIFGRWRTSARVGLVTNHPRSVPEAIFDEITRRRSGLKLNYATALEVVHKLVRWAA